MPDYQPLDLSDLCNAGRNAIPYSDPVIAGTQHFRGIPFQVGPQKPSDADSFLIAIGEGNDDVSIAVDASAKRVIFAHRLLESDLLEGGALGKDVADYVISYSDGESVTIPIRERYQIGVLGDAFTGAGVPFLAVTDSYEEVIPRETGEWAEAGRRQTEGLRMPTRAYYLWSWENPSPEKTIASITISPKGPRFALAGVTLGHIDEPPFATEGRREAKIEIKTDGSIKDGSPLEVNVDRGVATYVQPLPAASADGFVNDSHKGFGEELNTSQNPSYTEISATPSATVTVKQGDDEIGQVNWGDVEKNGSAESDNVRIELLDRGRNWVHVTVLDDETGRPVPCRVHFRSPEGVPYQPHGHHNQMNSNISTWHIDVGGDVRLGQITYAVTDGTCQGWLPRGDVLVDVARGFEYEPLRESVRIEPGQQELTLRLKRWTNMNAKRWFSGDSHVHFLSTQGSHIESQAEDLNIVNLLQSQWGSLFTNTEEFTGRASISQQGNNIVYVSQENRQHFLGHMILWGLKSPVMPWCSDGLNEAELGGTMETTMSHWADAAHEQGGSVIIPHFPSPNGEPATLVATGRVDAVEMIRQQSFNHIEYYRYLNAGYRIPLVGGTDKMSNEVPVGMYRTYAYIPEDREFTYDAWRDSVSKGRTFLSGGPIMEFSVDGYQIGDTMKVSKDGTVEIEASAESVIPINTLEIIVNGKVVASTSETNGQRKLSLKANVKIDGDSWIAARCGGPGYFGNLIHHDVWNRGVFAHTSPIYVTTGDTWSKFDEDSARYMMSLIEGSLQYVRSGTLQHSHGSITHHHGEADHSAYLERPFLEAQEAMQRRFREHGLNH